MKYKYRIYYRTGKYIDHCDPYAFYAELRPQTASIIYPLTDDTMHGKRNCKRKSNTDDLPLNIYEIHAGSWKKPVGTEESWYSYRDLAGLLIPYLHENRYNFAGIIPLNEYPCDALWGGVSVNRFFQFHFPIWHVGRFEIFY